MKALEILRRGRGWWLGAALLLLSLALDAWASLSLLRPATPLAAGAWLLAWPLLLVGLGLWLGRGWRGASVALRTAMLVLAAWLLASAQLAVLPQVARVWQLLQPDKVSERLQASLADNGRTLQLRGPVAPGDAARLRALLAQQAQLVRVDLAVAGGAPVESLQLAEAVRARGLATRLSGPCQRDCALLFLAGAQRQSLPGGQLQLQRLAPASLNPLWRAWLRREQARLYRAAGLTPVWVDVLRLSAPQRLTELSPAALRSAGLLTQAPFALDIELPPRAGAVVQEYQQALQAHPIWPLLEQRQPGTLAEVAERMHAAHQAGDATAPDRAAWQAADAVLQPRLAQLLQEAGGPLWQRYLLLLSEQLAALQRPEECRALLAGDMGVRRALPAALAHREAEWIAEAAETPASSPDQARLSVLEQEVLRRALGPEAAQALPRLWTPGGPVQRALDCRPASALTQLLLALPPAQRQLAARRLFARR
jgi:hypothetical protein